MLHTWLKKLEKPENRLPLNTLVLEVAACSVELALVLACLPNSELSSVRDLPNSEELAVLVLTITDTPPELVLTALTRITAEPLEVPELS